MLVPHCLPSHHIGHLHQWMKEKLGPERAFSASQWAQELNLLRLVMDDRAQAPSSALTHCSHWVCSALTPGAIRKVAGDTQGPEQEAHLHKL